MNTIAEPMISWSGVSKTCIESNQKHRVQQQEDLDDEDVEEALAGENDLVVVTDQSLVTTVKF